MIFTIAIFYLLDKNDRTIPICQKLIKKYPKISAEICVGGRDIGINPKINNLNQGYEKCSSDLIWICDSSIRVHSGTLTDFVSTFESSENVGIVHALPISCSAKYSFAALLEKVVRFSTKISILLKNIF